MKPVLTSAAVTALNTGSGQVANPILLRNPYNDKPMLLDEIRISNDSDTLVVNGDLQIRLELGGSGGIPITHGFVPVWTLGSKKNQQVTMQTWRLKKPLWVPPREVVSAVVQTKSGTAKNARVTYAGRVLEDSDSLERPDEIDVPWVSAFIAPNVAGGSDTFIESKSVHCVNGTNKVLHVDQLTGRISTTTNYTDPGTFAYGKFFLRITDSNNNAIIRADTPWADVFSMGSCAWPLKMDLQPRGFLRILIKEQLAGLIATTYTPMIAMIGHRKEKI